MATILFLSKWGDGYPLALRMAQEGHFVKFYVEDKQYQITGKGLANPKLVTEPGSGKDADLVIVDMVGLGRLADTFRKAGKVVLGGSRVHDELELNSDFALSVVKAFTHLVVPEEQVNGIEIFTEGWFDGDRFIPPFNHTYVYNRLMEGDKGPPAGCMGNIVWACDSDGITQVGLEPLTSFLKKARYTGPLGIDCTVTADACYFNEFIARFGYDTILAFGELLKGEWFTFLFGTATGTLTRVPVSRKFACGVRLSLSPYPSLGRVGAGLEPIKLDEEATRHFWPSSVMWKDKHLVTNGSDGQLGTVTAWGEDWREAKRRCYRTIENIQQTRDLQYRSDIGYDFEEQIQKVRTWGWIK